ANLLSNDWPNFSGRVRQLSRCFRCVEPENATCARWPTMSRGPCGEYNNLPEYNQRLGSPTITRTTQKYLSAFRMISALLPRLRGVKMNARRVHLPLLRCTWNPSGNPRREVSFIPSGSMNRRGC